MMIRIKPINFPSLMTFGFRRTVYRNLSVAALLYSSTLEVCLFMLMRSPHHSSPSLLSDWNQTEYGLPTPFERGEAGNILPLALQHLAPNWLSVLGIGALAAAVMSSIDSVLLSSASMFTQNIYRTTLRKQVCACVNVIVSPLGKVTLVSLFLSSCSLQASERELLWVVRISLVLVGLAGMGLAFGDDSVFSLWLLSGDLLYCIVLPQLVCVLYVSCANSYGAISGYVVAMLLRLLSGEPILGIPPLLLYPGWREEEGKIIQYFPYRTLAMLCSLLCIIMVSKLMELGICHQVIPQSWDLLGVSEEKNRCTEERGAPVCNLSTKL